MTASTLIKLLADKKVLTLPGLWRALYESELGTGSPARPPAATAKLFDYAAIFELNNVAPRGVSFTVNGAAAANWQVGQTRPEFTWTIPTGMPAAVSNPYGYDPVGQTLDDFEILIFDKNYSKVFYTDFNKVGATTNPYNLPTITITGNSATWQPNANTWQGIVTALGALPTNIYVVIAGQGTGFGSVLDPYWSDALVMNII